MTDWWGRDPDWRASRRREPRQEQPDWQEPDSGGPEWDEPSTREPDWRERERREAAGPGEDRPAGQHRPRRGRRPRAGALALAALIAVAVVIAGVWAAAPLYRGGKLRLADPPPAPAHSAATTAVLAAAESGLLPWHLPAPVSREVVLPGRHGKLIVLGGLTAGGVSASGVYSVGTRRGLTRRIGALGVAVHDAAGTVTGGRALIFGGGSSSSIATVQGFTLPGGPGGAAARPAPLPQARSDLAAVTIGATTYLVGGYDGARPDASVLATTDGRAFRTVTALRVPVRYPAVAALGGKIYVFGGLAVTGPHAGSPVNTIQAVDPVRHSSAVVGHLPETLAGAAAVTVAGEVFVAGGESTAPQPRTPGMGTTQYRAHGPRVGESGGTPTYTVSTIWAFQPGTGRLLQAGRLQVPVSHAGVAVSGSTAWIVGGESHGSLVAAVQMLRPNKAFGTAGAPGAGSPYFGAKLLVADRGNNRLLLLTDTMHVAWKYPSAKAPRDPLRFYFPDDAFFINHGSAIISNQEQNDTIVEIAYPSGKIIWSYGHPKQPGTGQGYLYEPDDAYLMRNGQITVADAYNCRVLVINHNGTVAHQIGTNGACRHNPPASMGTPNGDTPLADGNLLISEITGSWVTEYTPAGKLVWTVQLPISYPSDPQQLGPNRYLIADYSGPGQILEFNRAGRILYRYRVAAGPGRLDHPSLVELLPSGVFMANDDYNNRMVAIDPATRALVWQYGITGRHGTGPGKLHIPDGFDILLPNGTTPTHRATG